MLIILRLSLKQLFRTTTRGRSTSLSSIAFGSDPRQAPRSRGGDAVATALLGSRVRRDVVHQGTSESTEPGEPIIELNELRTRDGNDPEIIRITSTSKEDPK